MEAINQIQSNRILLNVLKNISVCNIFFPLLHVLNSEEAEALAKKLKLRFYRASVKEDLNVTEGKRLKILQGILTFGLVVFLSQA